LIKVRLKDFCVSLEPGAGFVCVSGVDRDGGDVRTLYTAAYGRLVGILAVAAGDRDEAEEVVQEAFVRLLPRWSKISRYDDPEAWVRQVAFRLLANRRRRRRLAHRLQLGAREGLPANSEESLDVSRALAALPFNQRQVVVLHHLLDLPVDQVAAELGVPVGTVKSRLARARAALLPLLGAEVADV
jgi:RNA polymerase sigma-70 factor, ECF subfamily